MIFFFLIAINNYSLRKGTLTGTKRNHIYLRHLFYFGDKKKKSLNPLSNKELFTNGSIFDHLEYVYKEADEWKHTVFCGPEDLVRRGRGLSSIARGALHSHLLADGWRWCLEGVDGKTYGPAALSLSLSSFLCSRFSVGSNESRQQHRSPAVTAGVEGWKGRRRWRRTEKKKKKKRRERGDGVFIWS